MKQYYIKPAYTGNYHVISCVDGKLSDRILAYYELSGYISCLEDQGYTKAYYLPEYEKKLQKAKEAYEIAMGEYEEAKANPLIVSEREAQSLMCLREDNCDYDYD